MKNYRMIDCPECKKTGTIKKNGQEIVCTGCNGKKEIKIVIDTTKLP